MSLRPKRVREAAHTVELAQHSFELGPVTQSYYRADGLAADDRRHAVRDQHPVPCEQHLIRAASLSGQHVTHAPRRYALVDPPSFDGALEAKQAPGFVVHERDTAVSVGRDHSLADAVEHRFALLEQRGDVARLQPESLSLQAPREQERAGDAEAKSESDVAADHRYPLEDRSVHLVLDETDRDDADHLAVGSEDGDLRAYRPPQRALLDADPRLALERRRRIGRDALSNLFGGGVRVADPVGVRHDDERRRLALANGLGDRLDHRRRLLIGEGLDHVGHRRDRMTDG